MVNTNWMVQSPIYLGIMRDKITPFNDGGLVGVIREYMRENVDVEDSSSKPNNFGMLGLLTCPTNNAGLLALLPNAQDHPNALEDAHYNTTNEAISAMQEYFAEIGYSITKPLDLGRMIGTQLDYN